MNKLLKIIYYIHVKNLNKKIWGGLLPPRPRITPSLFAMWDSCNKMCVKALFAKWDNCNKMCVKACGSLIWYYYWKMVKLLLVSSQYLSGAIFHTKKYYLLVLSQVIRIFKKKHKSYHFALKFCRGEAMSKWLVSKLLSHTVRNFKEIWKCCFALNLHV